MSIHSLDRVQRRLLLTIAVALAAAATLALAVTAAPASATIAGSGVAGGVLTVTADNGNDSIVITCDGGDVKINGADPLDGAALCADVTSIVVNAGNGTNTVNIDRTGFPATTTVDITTGTGTDDIDVSNGAGAVDVNAGNGTNAVTLAAIGAGDVTIDTGTGNDDIDVSAIVGVADVNAGNGTNSIDIPSVTGNAIIDAVGGLLNLNAGNGTNTIHVGSVAGDVDLDTGTGNDTVNLPNVGGLLDMNVGNGTNDVDVTMTGSGTVVVLAGTGNDQLRIRDAAASVNIAAGNGTNNPVLVTGHTGSADITTTGGTGGDTVEIDSSTTGSVSVTTGGGGDTVTVDAPNASSSSLTVNGDAGNDTLTIVQGPVPGSTIDGGANTDVCTGPTGTIFLNCETEIETGPPPPTTDVTLNVVLYNDDAGDGIDPADRLGAPHSLEWSDDGQSTTSSASDGDTFDVSSSDTIDYRLVSGGVAGPWQQTSFAAGTHDWELEFATIHFFLTDCTDFAKSKDPGFAYVDADNDQLYDGGLPAGFPWNLHVTGLYGPGEPGGELGFVDGFLVAHAPPATAVTAQLFFNGGAGGGPIPNPGFPAGLTTLNFTQGSCSADVLLDDGELTGAIGDQWAFDTDVPEGLDYTVAIPGAGLVIPASAGPLVNVQAGFDYRADGHLVVDTNIVATQASELRLISRHGDVRLDDPEVRAKNLVVLEALEGNVIATDGDIITQAASGSLRISASGIDVSNSILSAGNSMVIDTFEQGQGSVVAVNTVINQTKPNGIGPGKLQPGIPGGIGVGIYAWDDITVDGAVINARDLVEIASGRYTYGTGLFALACNGGGNGHLTIAGGVSTLLPGSTLGGARGVFISAGGFVGNMIDVSNSYIADARDGAGDYSSFGVAPVLLGARDINAAGATILGGNGAAFLFPFGGTVTAPASNSAGFSTGECVLP